MDNDIKKDPIFRVFFKLVLRGCRMSLPSVVLCGKGKHRFKNPTEKPPARDKKRTAHHKPFKKSDYFLSVNPKI